MPFDNTGLYTPTSGALTAAASQVISSAVWNAIFTDISAALTQLARGQQPQTARIITSPGNITVTSTDQIIIVQVSVPNINLPTSVGRTARLTILGNAAGIFSSNNSLIVPNGSEKIDGLNNVTLTVDYQSIVLLPLAAGGWIQL